MSSLEAGKTITTTTTKKITDTSSLPAQCTSSSREAHIYVLSADPCKVCNLKVCTLDCRNNSLHQRLLVFHCPTSCGATAKVLLDCGSTTNFISKRFVLKNHLTYSRINNSQVVKMPNGTIENTNKLVSSLRIHLNDRSLCEQLLVLPLESFDIILGIPWLRKYNPTINWQTNSLVLPPPPLASLVTEQVLFNKNIKEKQKQNTPSVSNLRVNTDIATPPSTFERVFYNKREIRRQMKKGWEFSLLFIRSKKQGYPSSSSSSLSSSLSSSSSSFSSLNAINTEQKSETGSLKDNILLEYSDVFPADLPKKLPPHRYIEHEIHLTPNASPPYENHRRMSPKDLSELSEHLTDLLDHGFIRESHSPFETTTNLNPLIALLIR